MRLKIFKGEREKMKYISLSIILLISISFSAKCAPKTKKQIFVINLCPSVLVNDYIRVVNTYPLRNTDKIEGTEFCTSYIKLKNNVIYKDDNQISHNIDIIYSNLSEKLQHNLSKKVLMLKYFRDIKKQDGFSERMLTCLLTAESTLQINLPSLI